MEMTLYELIAGIFYMVFFLGPLVAFFIYFLFKEAKRQEESRNLEREFQRDLLDAVIRIGDYEALAYKDLQKFYERIYEDEK